MEVLKISTKMREPVDGKAGAQQTGPVRHGALNAGSGILIETLKEVPGKMQRSVAI